MSLVRVAILDDYQQVALTSADFSVLAGRAEVVSFTDHLGDPITVCGTGGSAAATTELIWALIMSVARRIPAEDAAVRAGRWQTTLGTELAGSTLGIVGMGRLGQAVARYARVFDTAHRFRVRELR